jgi:biopolymer transport protein ExbD
MASREEAPQVNAGSMADIAFLLLIFFLVTTSIETDKGLKRMLPSESTSPPPPIPRRNILPILINAQDQLMVNNEVLEFKDLKMVTIDFLDNGGVSIESESYCDYCQGARDIKSSSNPDKAIVSLMSARETTYGVYITVQNELVAAYNALRNREAKRLYGVDFTALESLYVDSKTSLKAKATLKKKIRSIQKLFPMKLSEAERK